MMNFDEFINIANASFGNISSSIAPSGGYPEPLKNAAQSEPPVGCSVNMHQINQFRVLEAGYREWNSKINVISRTWMHSLRPLLRRRPRISRLRGRSFRMPWCILKNSVLDLILFNRNKRIVCNGLS